jgi:hypothetical protein
MEMSLNYIPASYFYVNAHSSRYKYVEQIIYMYTHIYMHIYMYIYIYIYIYIYHYASLILLLVVILNTDTS